MALKLRSSVGAGAVLVSAAAAFGGCGASGSATPETVSSPSFQAQPAPATAPRPTWRYLTAKLVRRTMLRSTPDGPAIKRLGTRTEFGSPAVLGVLRRDGAWLQVTSAALPNGRRGWIRARDARLLGTDYDIRVDRSARRAVLRRSGRAVVRFAVAVGRPGNETPLGRFAVTDMLRTTGAGSPYGCCIVALTGHQTKLDRGWPGGDRLAIHGTSAPGSIGRAASLGCLRTSESAVRALLRRVPLGTPVVISG
jgi:hypothetical protein